MTIITQDTELKTFYTLITSKGRKIEIEVGEYIVCVYVQGNSPNKFVAGRNFFGENQLAQAIKSYKAADIKDALTALQELISA